MTTTVARTTFNSQFGNDVLGMYVTWGVSASQTDTIGSADELSMKLNFNLYSVNLNTNDKNYTDDATGALAPGANSPYHFFFYMSWLMSDGAAVGGGPDATTATPYDALVGDLTMTVAEASPDTIDVQWNAAFGTNGVADYNCATSTCNSAPADDTGTDNNFSVVANASLGTSGMCTETWTVVAGDTQIQTSVEGDKNGQDSALICTKIEANVKRPFTNIGGDGAGDGVAANDQDLTFRAYSIGAGWRAGCATGATFDACGTQTAAPFIQDFSSQVVDYYDGFFVADDIYSGAIGNVSFAAAVIASTALLAF